MADCEMLPNCGFFHKYRDTLDLACRGFMNAYCRGERQSDCRRREHRARFGVAPSDDMLPSGQMMPESMRPGAR